MSFTTSETKCAVSEEGRKANMRSAMARGLPFVKKLPARSGKLAIVGSGPSVAEYHDVLKNWDGRIWAINGALNYLTRVVGRVPDGVVANDPQALMVDFFKEPPRGPIYYINSCCDPSVFDALKRRDVRVWHSNGDCNDILPSGTLAVPGGMTCLTRAPFLGYLVGEHDITIFGGDSSYSEVSTHVYQDGAYRGDFTTNDVIEIKCGGKTFRTEVGLLHQASNLGYIATMFPAKLSFMCGGLLKSFLESPMRDLSEFENAA